ncbi:myosin light chain kinase family member 4 isoform X2 [Rhinatrema bivittatum]|uniref:myosin light chain kinase family member 4 isoform X2 n=1 Tax=Rhinatrema bivittatum TaxID=194408 RepID=UPI00112DEB36|nr:myosin light chain kinase family member 4 isoform X2 [Rhinatrema bivittatum]
MGGKQKKQIPVKDHLSHPTHEQRERKGQSCTRICEATVVAGAHEQAAHSELKQVMKRMLKVNRLEENNTRYNSTRLSKIDFFHCLERVETMRSFWEEKSSEPESGAENDEVSRDQKAKEKTEKPCFGFVGIRNLRKKKPPDATVRSVQKNQLSSHKERTYNLNKENAENANTLLARGSTPKGYGQVPKEKREGTASQCTTELSPAAVPDGTGDILHAGQSHIEEETVGRAHRRVSLQAAEESQEALCSGKSREAKEEFKEERKASRSALKKGGEEKGNKEVEDESEEETVEEEESEAEEVVRGEVIPRASQDQGMDTAESAKKIARRSSSDGPNKELKPSEKITEEYNKHCPALLERYDDTDHKGSLSLSPNNELSVELSQGPGQNCHEYAISSKRRVPDEDQIKDDNKKSRTEATEGILNNKADEANLISEDVPEVPDSLEENQHESSIDDKELQIIIDTSPPPPAPFDHRIVSAKHAQINSFYTVSKTRVLGGGRFGQVHHCVEKSSGLTLAAKIIKARGFKEKEEVKNEIYVMNQLKHVNLLQLYDAFESKNDIVLIMEYVDGGELFDRIINENYNLTELDTILFIKQICEGIQYMHQMYFLHLDLKPENIMCVNQAANQIKIIDFGLARRYKPREKLKVNFGTPEFLAPEVVNYDFVSFPTDMWSIGVITYMLLSGLSPFLGEDDNETLNNILACSWDFEDDAFHDISEEAKDFITKLLVKEKCWRISATETLKHPWLSNQKLHCKLGHQRKLKSSSGSQAPMIP